MHDLGEVNYILGLKVHHDHSNRKIWLSQHKHRLDILHLFNPQAFQTCWHAPWSLSPLIKSWGDVSGWEWLYRCLVYPTWVQLEASCTWLSVQGLISLRLWGFWAISTHVQWVLRYLAGTLGLSLEFGPLVSGGVHASIFTDSDYAGDTEKACSTSGYASFIGSSCMNWSSWHQDCYILPYFSSISAPYSVTWQLSRFFTVSTFV